MFSSGGAGKGPALPMLLLVVVVLHLSGAAANSLVPSTAALTSDKLSGPSASTALRGVLRGHGTGGVDCSAIIIADHTITALDVVKGLPGGYAAGGNMLLQLPAVVHDGGTTNATQALHDALKRLMKMGRAARMITRCLTMLFVTDSKTTLEAMLDHSTDDRLMVWSTHAIIVTGLPEAIALPTVESKWAFTMMNSHLLLLRRPADGYRAQVFRHEPYSPEGKRTVRSGVYTATTSKFVLLMVAHYDKYANFFGGDVKFSALDHLPFVGVEERFLPNGTKDFVFSGMDYVALVTLGQVLNFKPAYAYGLKDWSEVEKEMTSRRSFILTCLYFVMWPRLQRYDFVAPLIIDDLTFAMVKPKKISNWDNFMLPFVMDVWLSILGALILISFCLLLTLEFSNLADVTSSKLRGGKQHVGSDRKISKSQAILDVFASLVGQDFTINMPHTHSFRILTTALFIFIIVISTGYKSKLISYMTSPKKPYRPETLKDLVDGGIIITAPGVGRDHRTMLRASPRQEHQILAERYTFVKNVRTGLELAGTQGSAHGDNRRLERFTIAENFMEADGSSEYYMGQEKILSLLMSMPVPHDAPYKPQFDRVMLHIVQSGLYSKWYKDVLESQRINKAEARDRHPDGTPVIVVSSDAVGVKPLMLDDFQGPFWILLFGVVLGALCFMLEFAVKKSLATWGNKDSDNDVDHNNVLQVNDSRMVTIGETTQVVA